MNAENSPSRHSGGIITSSAVVRLGNFGLESSEVGGGQVVIRRSRKSRPWTPGPGVTPEQQQAIIDAAETERDRLLVWTLFATGARIGEVVQLERDGLLDGRTIRLPLEKSKARQWNDVSIWPDDRELLFELQRFISGGGNSAYVFTGRNKIDHLSPRAAYDVFLGCSERAHVYVFDHGQRKLAHPHTARHTAARTDLRRGLNIMDVTKQRGWSKPMPVYLEPTAEEVAAKMEQVGR